MLMSQELLNPKIRFLGQKVCSVARWQTDRHTDRQSDYWGYPFRVSGFFPSTYHQWSPQKYVTFQFISILLENSLHCTLKCFREIVVRMSIVDCLSLHMCCVCVYLYVYVGMYVCECFCFFVCMFVLLRWVYFCFVTMCKSLSRSRQKYIQNVQLLIRSSLHLTDTSLKSPKKGEINISSSHKYHFRFFSNFGNLMKLCINTTERRHKAKPAKRG